MEIKPCDLKDDSLWKGLTIPSPFQEKAYLKLFSSHFGKAESIFVIQAIVNGKTLALFPFEKQNDKLIFLGMDKVLGKEEITDYGDISAIPLDVSSYAAVWDTLFTFLRGVKVNKIVLDYVREDSAIYKLFKGSQHIDITNKEVSPFIRLPQTWELYLESLDRTDRKELKRKMRRLESVAYSYDILPATDKIAMDEFVRLHRLSDGSKEKFMSPQMESFFRAVAGMQNSAFAPLIASLRIGGKTAASLYLFEGKDTAFLYNSAFDPQFGYYSGGLMSHALLIKRNIGKGLKIHDFMRGHERYKYDLGAKDKLLYRIVINL